MQKFKQKIFIVYIFFGVVQATPELLCFPVEGVGRAELCVKIEGPIWGECAQVDIVTCALVGYTALKLVQTINWKAVFKKRWKSFK